MQKGKCVGDEEEEGGEREEKAERRTAIPVCWRKERVGRGPLLVD